MQQLFFTYILLCSDSSYYIGVTNDLLKRIEQHNSDKCPGTYCHIRRPVILVFMRLFFDANKAIALEKQLKGWSRKKKEALIFNDLETLHNLAKCRNSSSHKNKKK